jgi:hypothetical protein
MNYLFLELCRERLEPDIDRTLGQTGRFVSGKRLPRAISAAVLCIAPASSMRRCSAASRRVIRRSTCP